MVESRWAITSVVRFSAIFFSSAWIAFSVRESSAEVASSKIRIFGLVTSARAIAMRWRWPPERLAPRSPSTVS